MNLPSIIYSIAYANELENLNEIRVFSGNTTYTVNWKRVKNIIAELERLGENLTQNMTDLNLFQVYINNKVIMPVISLRSEFLGDPTNYDLIPMNFNNQIDDGKLPSSGPFLYYYNDQRAQGGADDRRYLPVEQHQVNFRNAQHLNQIIQPALDSLLLNYNQYRSSNDIFNSVLPSRLPPNFQTTYSISSFDSSNLKAQRYYNFYMHGWLFDNRQIENGAVGVPFIGIFKSNNIKNPLPDDNWIPFNGVKPMDQHIHKETEYYDFMPEPLISWNLGSWQSRFAVEDISKPASAIFVTVDPITARIHVSLIEIKSIGI